MMAQWSFDEFRASRAAPERTPNDEQAALLEAAIKPDQALAAARAEIALLRAANAKMLADCRDAGNALGEAEAENEHLTADLNAANVCAERWAAESNRRDDLVCAWGAACDFIDSLHGGQGSFAIFRAEFQRWRAKLAAPATTGSRWMPPDHAPDDGPIQPRAWVGAGGTFWKTERRAAHHGGASPLYALTPADISAVNAARIVAALERLRVSQHP